MTEDDVGKVFLFALPWDWTFVGRFAGYSGGLMVLEEAGYFSRTGRPFGQLCKEGFVLRGDGRTIFNPCGTARVHAQPNVVLRWEADWPQPAGGGR